MYIWLLALPGHRFRTRRDDELYAGNASRPLMAQASLPLLLFLRPILSPSPARIRLRPSLRRKPGKGASARGQIHRLPSLEAHAVVSCDNDGSKWWERSPGPNMIDVHSTQEFLNALCEAGDRLVIVEFYGTWCASCRAIFPKLCRTARDQRDILFLKVNFDENKPMCKRLNVKVLPYFHFYRGADGLLDSFSCSLPKFQKIRDAITIHNTPRCSIGPPLGVGNLNFLEASASKQKSAEAQSR